MNNHGPRITVASPVFERVVERCSGVEQVRRGGEEVDGNFRVTDEGKGILFEILDSKIIV